MFVRGRPTAAALDRLVAEQASLALTYSEVGATRGRMPDGYRHDEHRMELGVVRFTVRAFSRPRHPLARLSGPAARRVQLMTTRRYMRALKEFVSGSPA